MFIEFIEFMRTRQRRRTGLLILFMPPLTLLALIYFGYHAFHGELGIFERARISGKIENLEAELASLKGEHARLEKRVSLLRNESLSEDLVEEQARFSLGYGKPDEIVVLLPKHAQSN